jgi:hypothetical protein
MSAAEGDLETHLLETDCQPARAHDDPAASRGNSAGERGDALQRSRQVTDKTPDGVSRVYRRLLQYGLLVGVRA